MPGYGTTKVLENNVVLDIMEVDFSDMLFAKTIIFISNICTSVIYLRSYDLHYMLVMQYANITIFNTTHRYQIIGFETTINNDIIFPYCIFQYMELVNHKSNVNRKSNTSELDTVYTISLSGNKQITENFDDKLAAEVYNFYDYLSHCK